MGEAYSSNGENGGAQSFQVGKFEEKRLLRRSQHKWVDNIKIYLQEVEWGAMERIDLAQYRQLTVFCECDNKTSGTIMYGEISYIGEHL